MMIRRPHPVHATTRPRMRLLSGTNGAYATHRVEHDAALQRRALAWLKSEETTLFPPRITLTGVPVHPSSHHVCKSSRMIPSTRLPQPTNLSGKFWFAVVTLAWFCAVTTSAGPMTQNDGWNEKMSMRERSRLSMEWCDVDAQNVEAMVSTERAVQRPQPRRNGIGSRLAMWALRHLHAQAFEPLISPYEHITDIHVE
ncbi:hypothetical protein H310_01334 [Aphanomyces invadans]|uniref:Uncharacterized protein n=1 Tax=Aphanomyces invadans TaxID=157072 RepID=A0A024UT50_9STRA|nr:hypothetical protein H310_01334 [Aphanomyces invadans]ETW08828.1 hypothetical protein H310_01334 [Aphanomyces invadans]|eukprot:XP_008862633.1 hypothetical protein H310_01334 [Aphanomyces invadans]